MFGNRKWRERREREAQLRQECAELRFVSAWADLDSLDTASLRDLLQRSVNARAELEKVIYAHDDSPRRLITTGIGVGTLAIGIVTLGSGPILLPALGVVGGAALVANDAAGLTRTKIELAYDQHSVKVLSAFSAKVRTILRERGAI